MGIGNAFNLFDPFRATQMFGPFGSFGPFGQDDAVPAADMLGLFGQDQFGMGSSGFGQNIYQQMMMLQMLQFQFGLMLLAEMLTSGVGQQQNGGGGGGRNCGCCFPNGGWNGMHRRPGGWDPSGRSTRTNPNGNASMPNPTGNYRPGAVYPPGSSEARALFREAAQRAGLPPEWGDSPALHNILRRESNGQVGRPNYTYGSRARDQSQWASVHAELRAGNRTTRSSATGLGQLLLGNVDKYYPSGRAGIGDPMEEAMGMLNYINDRYGSPERAWELYGVRHEGY